MPGPLSLPTEKLTLTIEDLVNLHRQDRLVVNEEYQRSEVWKRPRQQRLIDSILNDYDIGAIILRQKEDKWEILDGQQRLKAVFDFVENEMPLSKKETAEPMAGKRWRDLEARVQWGQFMIRKVYVTRIYSANDEITSRIFLRVQEGLPLNGAEKLNAMRGKCRNEIAEISEHSFFKQTKVSKFRFAYRYLCAQIALQETGDGIAKQTFGDAKFRNLKKMYEDYREGLPPKVTARMASTLDFLQLALKASAQTIKEKSDLLTVYALASYLLQKFAMKGREDKFRDFIVAFFASVERPASTDTEGYYGYWVARSSSPDSKKQIERRFGIALKTFLSYDQTIEPKDAQREFEWGQKLAIYAKAYAEARKQGKEEAACKICSKPTPLDRGEPDHIKPHSLGGLTTVENGQWTCITCNRSKSDKYAA